MHLHRWLMILILPVITLLPVCAQDGETWIPDPDFEGDTVHWGLWPEDSQSLVELDNTVAYRGNQSLRVTAVRSGDRAVVNILTDRFDKKRLYRLSFYVRKDETVPESAISFHINFRGGEEGTISSRAMPYQVRREAHGEWTRWSGLFFVAENQQVDIWQVCLNVENTVGRVWFDAIEREDLGSVENIELDVWTNFTADLEVGSGPAQRFTQHMQNNTPVYQMAERYNALVWESAWVEREMRDARRVLAYAKRPVPEALTTLFTTSEAALDEAYRAYVRAFHSGAEADRTAFYAAADRLAVAQGALRAEADRQKAVVTPAAAPAMPARLGRQSWDIPPIEPNGRLNRLLIGVWSPLTWAHWEEPFEFEFHSSAPGSPRVHTETEMDFSNVTEACQTMEDRGYRGTFSYLMFGIHEHMYAPTWLIERHKDEPDFYKLSWDGLNSGERGGLHSLNYFHPAVREFIHDYLGAYARYCRDEPRILFHEVAQEAYTHFSAEGKRRLSIHGPHAEAAFRDYLQARYPTIAALNTALGTNYADFSAIAPPPDPLVQDRELTPLVAEFEAFCEQAYIDYLKLIYDSLKAGDPDKPVVSRHSALIGGVGSINGARLFETCDVLTYHQGAPNMQIGNVYLNSLNRYHNRGLGYMEDFWGMQEERTRVYDEIAQRRGLEKHMARTLIWGRNLQMKWYAYTSGVYIFTYNGNWFYPRYDVTTLRYSSPALAVAKRKMENLDWVLTHSAIEPSRLLVLQPSAAMRNERPLQDCFSAIRLFHELLYKNGFMYELLPEEYVESGQADLAQFDVIVLPNAFCLSEDLQRKLGEWTLGGGMLIALGEPGRLDEIARPTRTLADLLAGGAQGDWAAVETLWQTERTPDSPGMVRLATGDGMLLALPYDRPGLSLQTREEILGSINMHSSRPVWGENAAFEVVLRTTEEGDRYLFILNPDVDEERTDTIHMNIPVNAVTDVSLPGGYPVALEIGEATSFFTLTLPPGDTAILWIGTAAQG